MTRTEQLFGLFALISMSTSLLWIGVKLTQLVGVLEMIHNKINADSRRL